MGTDNPTSRYLDKLDDLRERRLAASSVGREQPIWANGFYKADELDHSGELIERIEHPAHFFCISPGEAIDESPSPEELVAAAEDDWDVWDGRVLGQPDGPPMNCSKAA